MHYDSQVQSLRTLGEDLVQEDIKQKMVYTFIIQEHNATRVYFVQYT